MVTDEKFHAFLSHAGEQKKGIVDFLHSFLTSNNSNIRVFLDEHSLQPGTKAWSTIEKAAEQTSVAVVVLSREFVYKQAPMAELKIFLQRAKDDAKAAQAAKDAKEAQHCTPGTVAEPLLILPVFWELSWEKCRNLLHEVYSEWPFEHIDKPSNDTLVEWAALGKQLSGFTGIRADQTQGYQGRLAELVADAVVKHLKAVHLLPPDYKPSSDVPWEKKSTKLQRPAHGSLLGRQEEMEKVLAGVRGPARAALLVGGPGEGKSAVAACAGLQLFEEGWFKRGALVVDFAGYRNEPVQDFVAANLHQQLLAQGRWDVPQDATWEQFVQWLNKPGEWALLVVLENTEEVLQSEDSSVALYNLLASMQRMSAVGSSPCVRLIICSRQEPGWGLAGAPQVKLNALPTKAAEQLLLRHAGSEVVEEGQAARLVQICGGNALAITIIGGFIAAKRSHCTPQMIIDDHSASGKLAEVGRSGTQPQLATHLGHVREWLKRYLHPDELDAVARLSMFSGSFTVQAALAVGVQPDAPAAGRQAQGRAASAAGRWGGGAVVAATGPAMARPGECEAGVQAMLEQLASGSVLQAATPGSGIDAGGAARFQMHPLIRVLGAELLKDLDCRASGEPVERLMLQWMLVSQQGPGQCLVQRIRGWVHSRGTMQAHGGLGSAYSERPPHDVVMEEYANFAEAARLLENWGSDAGWHKLLADSEAVWLDGEPMWPEVRELVVGAFDVLQALLAIQVRPLACRFLEPAGAAAAARLDSKRGAHGLPAAIVRLLLTYVQCLDNKGQLSEAQALGERLLDVAVKVLGPTHQAVAHIQAVLVDTYSMQGNFLGAAGLQQQLLAEVMKAPGSSRRPEGLAHQVYWGTNDVAQVLMHCNQLLDMYRGQLGASHPEILGLLELKDYALRSMGLVAEAEKVQQELVRVHTDKLGCDHPATLMAMANLASSMGARGNFAEASDVLESVLEKATETMGSGSVFTLQVANSLAFCCRKLGRDSRALQLDGSFQSAQQQQQQQQQQLLWSNKSGDLARLQQQMEVHMREGDYDRAITLRKQLLAKCKQQQGPDSPVTVAEKVALATMYQQRGDVRRALDLVQQALASMRRQSSSSSSSTSPNTNVLEAQAHIGLLLRLMGDFAAATELQRQVLAAWQELLGEDHAATLEAKSSLAVTLRRQGRLQEALRLEQQVLASRLAVSGGSIESPACGSAMLAVATTLRDLGALQDAAQRQRQALQVNEQRASTGRLSCKARLAVTLHLLGHHDEAVIIEQQMLQACQDMAKSAEHMARLTAVAGVAVYHWHFGDLDAAKVLQAQLLKAAELELGSEHPSTARIRRNLTDAMRTVGYLPGYTPAPFQQSQLPAASPAVGGPEGSSDVAAAMAHLRVAP